MKKRIMRLALFICALSMLLCPLQGMAAESGSVSISCRDGDSALEGAAFELFFAAEYTDGEYRLCGEFADLPVEMDFSSSEALARFAETLEGLVDLNEITADFEGVTDGEGTLSFTELRKGMYLLRGGSHRQNGKIYTVKPVVIFIPAWDEAEESWVYDITLSPKWESAPDVDEPGFVRREVLKVWRDGEGEQRPNEVTVHLLRNGELYDSVTLSAANGWSHVWDTLEDKYVWTLTEDVPEGYTVTVTQEGVTFVVTNTKPYTPPPPPPPPPDIPQTGQLWWPVPIMAIAGLVLFVAGFVRNRKDYEA